MFSEFIVIYWENKEEIVWSIFFFFVVLIVIVSKLILENDPQICSLYYFHQTYAKVLWLFVFRYKMLFTNPGIRKDRQL